MSAFTLTKKPAGTYMMVLPLLYLLTISWKSGPCLCSWDGSVWTQGSQKGNNKRMRILSMTAGYSHSYLAGRVYTRSSKGLLY